jgi:DNA-binding MarR family transcriptional regulator
MGRDPSLTEELHTLGAILRTPFEAMLAYNYARLAEEGFDDVRPAHGAVLRHIARDGSRITELAQNARMTKQSMAELVEHLRRRGYVELVPDPSDGRAKLARLTERGFKVHGALARISRDFEKVCAQSFGTDKWRRLRALLEDFANWSKTVAPAE